MSQQRMKNWIFIILMVLSTSIRTQIYGDYSMLFGSGIGQMNDLRFYGLGFGFGYQAPCSVWGLGIYMSQRASGGRSEVLPMYTEYSGFGEHVAVENNSTHNTLTLNFRYLQLPNESRWQSYLDFGAGIVTYKNFWESQGKKIPNSSSFFGMFNSYDHVNDGVNLRNLTYQGTGEIGLAFRWGPARENCSSSFSAIAIRMEYGGRVQYMLPKVYHDHFYYESGMENLPNAPFSTNYFNEARQMTVSLRFVLWRTVI